MGDRLGIPGDCSGWSFNQQQLMTGLSGCRVTQRGSDSLASDLCSNPSHLRYNHPGDSEVKVLSAAKLDTLTLL
ncbi:hypothetical protein COCON_G00193570 [Conger conger]|uniref:Uncharacterized protein n=1 Tax=Conger conger TaxID=82655 RepID=A0A9Q1D1I5_CONCO|nr:hypothetical protein COCON_G00193570 [Conger conger]